MSKILSVLLLAGSFAGMNANQEKLSEKLLNHTILNKDPKTITKLITQGANVNIQSNEGDTPLHYSKNNTTTQILIEHGADINAKNLKGDTPLIRAVSYPQNYNKVKTLLEHSAKINIQNEEGHTALKHATLIQSSSTALLFLGLLIPLPFLPLALMYDPEENKNIITLLKAYGATE